MYPLSAFVTLLSGFPTTDCTSNFIYEKDYFVQGKNAFIALSSAKWDKVSRVQTSSVSALDYISVDADYINNLNAVEFNPYNNQPFLTGGDTYNFNTGYGVLCAYNYNGREFIANNNNRSIILSNCLAGNGSGYITLQGSNLQQLMLLNVGVSGIFISNNVYLTACNFLFFQNTFLIGGTGGYGFEVFLSHLAQYGPNYGYIQVNDAGYNNVPPSNMNPFRYLNTQGLTAMDALTGTKRWYYRVI